MRPTALALAALAATMTLAADSTSGALRVTKPGGETVDMPLRHTKVSIEVSAFVARATVEQVFANPFDTPIEAVYTFPLGDRAAVDDFELTVGDRTIRGEIKRREEARAIYQQARAAGYQAALLEQERPNIFTQSVANLEPGKEITVRLRTVETLVYERGTYRLAFPLVVGPRYIPGGNAVPDAARLNAPVLPPGMRSGHDVSIEVALDAGVPISNLTSPSHKIVSEARSLSRAHVRLADGDAIPNKDFLLRWSVSSERPAVGFLAHRDGLDGFFTLLVQPKGEIDAAEAMPKEIVFVLDTSGSMYGVPLDASKRLVAKALRAMGPRDTFNLVRFAGDNEVYSKTFLPNDRGSVEGALKWFEAQQGGGGTELLAAMRAAFLAPPDPNRLRVVVFLTDGYVGNEPQILAEIGKVLGDARIYTIGIGGSVNHYLLDRMADLGRGAYVFVRPDERADDALEAFRSWVTKPYLTDLSIDWGALPVADFGSERLRDLGSGQTLTLVGRYLDSGEGDVVVRGRLAGRPWEQRIHVKLPDKEARHEALAPLWARGRIEELTLGSPQGVTESVRAEVTALALEYRLMSAFTSFVAVDDSQVVNPGGASPTVHQAVPIPDGVSFEGIFGKEGPAPEHVERVTVMAEKTKVDLDQAPAGTKFTSDFIQDLPVAGRFYQNVLALPPPAAPGPSGDGNPNVNGARDRDFKTQVSGISNVDPLAGQFPNNIQADSIGEAASTGSPGAFAQSFEKAKRVARLESPERSDAEVYLLAAAFRVLADIADDGRISPAEGRPALAALLAAQRADGSIGPDAAVHAVATWALAEAALELPGEPFVKSARAKALGFLVTAAKGTSLDPESARWVRLVLGAMDPAAAASIAAPVGNASVTYERLRSALAGSRSGSAAKREPGRAAFDRLVATIGRKNLKVVRG
jgi:Ca-activated chloride channel family protein